MGGEGGHGAEALEEVQGGALEREELAHGAVNVGDGGTGFEVGAVGQGEVQAELKLFGQHRHDRKPGESPRFASDEPRGASGVGRDGDAGGEVAGRAQVLAEGEGDQGLGAGSFGGFKAGFGGEIRHDRG